MDKGHGRIEIRTAQCCDLLKSWLQSVGFVGAEQVIRVQRVRKIKGKESLEVEYYLSSLATTKATALDLMTWIRAHWGIENKVHYVRDVTFDEDRCRVRKGGSAQVLAVLRNAANHLLGSVEALSKRAATQRLQVHPEEAIDLLRSQAV